VLFSWIDEMEAKRPTQGQQMALHGAPDVRQMNFCNSLKEIQSTHPFCSDSGIQQKLSQFVTDSIPEKGETESGSVES